MASQEEAQILVLREMFEVWEHHHQMMVMLSDKFLRTQIVSCASVANFIFSKELTPEFSKLVATLFILSYTFNFDNVLHNSDCECYYHMNS